MDIDMTEVNSLLGSWQQLLFVSATFFVLLKNNGVRNLVALYFLYALLSGAIYFITYGFLDEPIFIGLFSGEIPWFPIELLDSEADGGLTWLGWIILLFTFSLLAADTEEETVATTSNENKSSQVSEAKEEIAADKKPVKTSPKKEKSELFDKKNKLDDDLFDDL